MKKSEAIREIWELLENNTEDNSKLSSKIMEKILELGMAAPEYSRNVKTDELLELSLSGYDISEEDFIMVREWEDEDSYDKDKLN